MTNKALVMAGLSLALSGCGSEGLIVEGITAQVAAVHYQAREQAALTAKHSEAPTKTLHRSDGMRIDLQGGLLALRAIGLQSCHGSALALGGRMLDWLIPAAHAHGAAGDGLLSILDVVEPADGETTGLGEIPVAPGDYCGIELELASLTALPPEQGDHHAADEDSGEVSARQALVGHAVLVRPCYYPYTAGEPATPLPADSGDLLNVHECVEARHAGPARRFVVNFVDAVSVAHQRALSLDMGVAYDRWFDDIAMDQLASDPREMDRLLDNVVAAISVRGVTQSEVAADSSD